jgi:hypothetical protein
LLILHGEKGHAFTLIDKGTKHFIRRDIDNVNSFALKLSVIEKGIPESKIKEISSFLVQLFSYYTHELSKSPATCITEG